MLFRHTYQVAAEAAQQPTPEAHECHTAAGESDRLQRAWSKALRYVVEDQLWSARTLRMRA